MGFLKGIYLVLVFFTYCLPSKVDVQVQDVQKVLERLAYVRFVQRLELEEEQIKTDLELLQEICAIYRLDIDSVLEKLKQTHPKLYQKLGKKHEK
jgi:hypothetical protein